MNSFLKFIGFLLLAGGLAVLASVGIPVFQEEIRFQGIQARTFTPDIKKIEPVSSQFGLLVPKIDLNVAVFTDVNADDPEEYEPVLTKGVAHALGSGYPGSGEPILIFAHSTNTLLGNKQSQALFYLISKLDEKDQVVIYFWDKRFDYKVIEQKTVSPIEVAGVLTGLRGEYLVLQTCTPPGTSLRRLLVIAKRVI